VLSIKKNIQKEKKCKITNEMKETKTRFKRKIFISSFKNVLSLKKNSFSSPNENLSFLAGLDPHSSLTVKLGYLI
jgi:hypothetical protein